MIFFVSFSTLLIVSNSALAEVSSSCKVRNGFEQVDGVCDAYIECQDYTVYEKLCPDGLYFDPNAQWPSDPCGYPSDLPCKGLTQPADSTADCPHQYGFFPFRGANINDCGQYRMCVEGRALDMYCPTGLAFNPVNNRCDWPAEVSSCNLKNFLGFTCPASNRVTNHKYENSCYEFYSCINGNPRLLSCDPGYAFDERKARCVDAHLVNCDHQ